MTLGRVRGDIASLLVVTQGPMVGVELVVAGGGDERAALVDQLLRWLRKLGERCVGVVSPPGARIRGR